MTGGRGRGYRILGSLAHHGFDTLDWPEYGNYLIRYLLSSPRCSRLKRDAGQREKGRREENEEDEIAGGLGYFYCAPTTRGLLRPSQTLWITVVGECASDFSGSQAQSNEDYCFLVIPQHWL